jgi:hypothetical protein
VTFEDRDVFSLADAYPRFFDGIWNTRASAQSILRDGPNTSRSGADPQAGRMAARLLLSPWACEREGRHSP